MAGAEEKAIAKTTRETVIEAAAQPIEKLVREELDRLEAGRSEAVRARLEPPRSPPRLTVAALASFLRALTLASDESASSRLLPLNCCVCSRRGNASGT